MSEKPDDSQNQYDQVQNECCKGVEVSKGKIEKAHWNALYKKNGSAARLTPLGGVGPEGTNSAPALRKGKSVAASSVKMEFWTA